MRALSRMFRRADRGVEGLEVAPAAVGRSDDEIFAALAGDRNRSGPPANPVEEAFHSHSGRPLTKWHHYLAVYDRHLRRYRGGPVRLLEIGVNQGGSLQLWRRYLGEAATIHGLDIDPACAALDGPGSRVHIGSQDDPELLRRIVAEMGGVDVVIDDGSHRWPHQIASFETLYPVLAGDGVYICEDVHTAYWPNYGAGSQTGESFIAYAKRRVDDLHAWYRPAEPDEAATAFARMTGAIAFHDSMVVFEKEVRSPPVHVTVGEG